MSTIMHRFTEKFHSSSSMQTSVQQQHAEKGLQHDDFLPHHITTVARTGKRISFIFFWRRPRIETKTSR